MNFAKKRLLLALAVLAALPFVLAACSSDPEIIEVTREVEVKGDTVEVPVEVTREVEVKGDPTVCNVARAVGLGINPTLTAEDGATSLQTAQVFIDRLGNVLEVRASDAAIDGPQVAAQNRLVHHVSSAAHANECPLAVSAGAAVAPEAETLLPNNGRDFVFVQHVGGAACITEAERHRAADAADALNQLV